MRKFSLRITCCCIVLLLSSIAYTQQGSEKKLTGDYKDAAIATLVNDLEQQSGYHFYYDAAQFDTTRFSLSFKNETLRKILEFAFANTDFHFTIMDEQQFVLLTKGVEIKSELPAGFFAKGKRDTAQSAVPSYGDKKKVKTDVAVDNKIYEIGPKNSSPPTGNLTLAGYIRNSKTGEPIVGASIFLSNSSVNTTTDQYGYYSLSVPKGRHVINVQGIGMRDLRRQVMLYASGKFDIDMDERVISLKEVIVSAQKVANIRATQMGLERLTIRSIKQVPTAFGEADILKSILTLPGVKTVGEASTGFNVRGGSADQNLILFNDATIFNPSHFFGFFSAFNPDIVKDVELYKSSIPAKYGGRLSSVLDISSREGNKKEYHGTAGIGLLTSRINVEGPIQKNKSSFIFGARTTYANWLLQLLPAEYKHSKAAFYDINLDISHQFNNKNTLFLTGYFSKDHFNLNSDTAYGYSNANASAKWKHIFSNKINMIITGGYDHYDYKISSEKNKVNAYKLAFNINQLYFKTDFTYYVNANHTVDFGLSSIKYKLSPGTYGPLGDQSLVVEDKVEAEQALESAIYLGDRWNPTSDLSIQAGIRYSVYNYLGPKKINEYPAGQPKQEDNILQTKPYGSGDFIKTYHGPEYRFSIRYSLAASFSVKAGYNSLRQYIHVLSNTTAISPTDIWKLSDPNIKPQYGDQVSFGLYKNFKSNTIEVSAEVYYKRITDYLDYKSGAKLVLNHHIETDVMSTKGKAYGIEVQIKKQNGKLNGWISYTYSRILLKMDDSTAGEIVNRGEYYPASYDKPNDITMVGNYRFSHRFSVSMNVTYSTGRPITLPIGRFYYAGSYRALYADRNAYRIPDYFRTDLAMNIEGNHKVKQKTHNSWTIGVYNLTGRKNPYSVYFISENGVVNGYKLSIFGNALPFVNFNIRF